MLVFEFVIHIDKGMDFLGQEGRRFWGQESGRKEPGATRQSRGRKRLRNSGFARLSEQGDGLFLGQENRRFWGEGSEEPSTHEGGMIPCQEFLERLL